MLKGRRDSGESRLTLKQTGASLGRRLPGRGGIVYRALQPTIVLHWKFSGGEDSFRDEARHCANAHQR